MTIRIYNSMTDRLEEFQEQEKGRVSIYYCGPTVYNYPHIGNMRPPVVFDVLKRTLLYYGYDVKLVSNVTDVDDKIIKAAKEKKQSEREVAAYYENCYFAQLSRLHVAKLDAVPHAVATIGPMIEFIKKLIDLGAAYEIDGDVFFRVAKAPEYGKLGNFNINDLQVGARVEENDKKENPLDFTLWKKTEEGVKFDSPWGKGRPGWHTECAVMIHDVFNTPLIDIHGGGFDLKFPHHENEIAQARAAYGTSLARYWMHVGFVNIDNEKMSKSLGNVIDADKLINKYGGNTVRLVLLSTYYRAPLNISDAVILNAKKAVDKIKTAVKQAEIQLQYRGVSIPEKGDKTRIAAAAQELAADLNTPNALSVLYEAAKDLNVSLRAKKYAEAALLLKTCYALCDLLGFAYLPIELGDDDIALMKKWQDARERKDFVTADMLRQKLSQRGLV